jgi:hypothetical protein
MGDDNSNKPLKRQGISHASERRRNVSVIESHWIFHCG